MHTPPVPPPGAGSAAAPRREEGGFALIMVLIFSILLYVMVAELVTTARMARFTGENDALLARMRNHQLYTLQQVEEMLLDDLQAAAAGGESGAMAPTGGAGGLGGLAGAAGGEGAGGEGGGEDPAANADCSQDSWYEPQAFSDGDITTYVWVEDENRKFNVLSLVSADEEYAREARSRFVRLIDHLREDTPQDLTIGDGERLVTALIDWMRGQKRSPQIPRAPLKSDDPEAPEYTLPLHLDELKLVEGFTDDLFYDKVLDSRLMPGLESVLTVYTALAYDPGDPDKQQQRRSAPGGSAANAGGSTGNPQAGGAGEPGAAGGQQGTGAASAQDPIDPGVRININTAPRAVLRALFPPSEIPPATIEAILRYRNEEAPEEEGEQLAAAAGGGDYYGDVMEGEKKKLKVFSAVEDLDQLPEFMNLANPAMKEKFYAATTVRSHVFTVHMASLFKRSERNKVFVIKRSASMLVRVTDQGDEAQLVPIVRLEDRHGVRVMGVDYPERYLEEVRYIDDMDQFAREEKRWNPFLLDFYLPEEQRGY